MLPDVVRVIWDVKLIVRMEVAWIPDKDCPHLRKSVIHVVVVVLLFLLLVYVMLLLLFVLDSLVLLVFL